ncbi:GNAT family N-acetyltransferase [Haloechinothrix sp. LS1_15]|nr:GNAT family N-acetyltransferase [Haloechinothrix sp. LS1_15]
MGLLREYVGEIMARELHRVPSEQELAESVAEQPGRDLAPPRGALLVAYASDTPAGCIGVRLLDAETCEIKRMFVRQSHRRRGLGQALLDAAERHARTLGAQRVVLDTRSDLTEARTLYTAHGYTEIADYNGSTQADRWYGKPLR